jgi:hypothetical protein
MRIPKPSLEVAARAARRLRDHASGLDIALGDPGPGLSALERRHAKPPEPAKTFSISAAFGQRRPPE